MLVEPQLTTPVILFVFRRPDCTAKVLERIRLARPARLWIIADGPRPERPDDVQLVAQVRNLIKESVNWPCRIERLYARENLGCARRVSSGIDAVFAKEEQAIILEDDCVPDPTFFRFCSELLDRYRNNGQVAAISGDNFQRDHQRNQSSYYFSRFPHCWGWATWRRAWRYYDHTMGEWPRWRAAEKLSSVVSSAAEKRYWTHAFDQTLAGGIDSWANRWTFACWMSGGLTILPEANLVSNIGFNADATHTRKDHPVARLSTQPADFPLRHPSRIEVNSVADAYTATILFHRCSLPRRVFRGACQRLFLKRAMKS